MDFTYKTLQEYENVDPQGIDILFEYKVKDEMFLKEEAI